MSKARDELQKKINDLMCEAISAARYNNPGWLDLQIKNEEQILSQVDTYVKGIIATHDQEVAGNYDDIFKWLLGEDGDFPASEPGKRYNWRPELRNRLKRLQSKKGKS